MKIEDFTLYEENGEQKKSDILKTGHAAGFADFCRFFG